MTEPELDYYLASYRDGQGPPREVLEAVYQKVATEVGPGGPPGGGVPLSAAKLAAALAVAAGVVWALVPAPPTESPSPPSGAPPIAVAPVVPSAPVEGSSPEDATDRSPQTSVLPRPAEPPAQARTKSERTAVPQTWGRKPRPSQTAAQAKADVAEDLRRLQEIRRLVVAGKHRQALERIVAHANELPQSPLSRERDVLEIEALCGSGNRIVGKRKAKSFLRRYPGSVMEARVKAACDLD